MIIDVGQVTQVYVDAGDASVLAAVPSAAMAFTNKTGNISQWTNDSGYITSAASALLSATHTDTTAGTVARGDLITGQGATPKWVRLPKGSANQVLAMDGTATDITWTTLSGSGDALTTNPLSQFASTTSLQLKGVISDETGSGALVFADTPTLVTPVLGVATGTRLTLSPSGAVGLTVTGATETTSQPLISTTQTWNASGVAFTAFKQNITDTASAAASLHFDFQRAGVSQFKLQRGDGGSNQTRLTMFDPTQGTVTASISTNTWVLNNISSTNNVAWGNGWATLAGGNGGGNAVTLTTGNGNIVLIPGTTNTVEQRNGTNAQRLNIYNTFTSTSVFEDLSLYFASNVAHIGTATTGATARVLQLDYGGTTTAAISIPITSGAVSLTGSILTNSATSIPAGGTAGAGLMVSSTSNFGVFFGSGAPTLSAAKGSLYLRSDGSGTSNRAYVNTDGGTTWTAIATAA